MYNNRIVFDFGTYVAVPMEEFVEIANEGGLFGEKLLSNYLRIKQSLKSFVCHLDIYLRDI